MPLLRKSLSAPWTITLVGDRIDLAGSLACRAWRAAAAANPAAGG
jgi:hypothetical protein